MLLAKVSGDMAIEHDHDVDNAGVPCIRIMPSDGVKVECVWEKD